MADLASLNDVQTHLEEARIRVDDTDIELLQLEVSRTIKGMLSNTFSATTLAAWDEPANTPEMIRSIAGRLIAARHYIKKLSEEQVDVPEYGQWLYDNAMLDLNGVINGSLILVEVEEEVNTGGQFREDNIGIFAEPKFTMDAEY